MLIEDLLKIMQFWYKSKIIRKCFFEEGQNITFT